MFKLALITFAASVLFIIGFEIIYWIDISAAIKLPIYIGFIFLILFSYIKSVEKIFSKEFF